MTADERLALVQIKIERAKKHIVDLAGEIGIFRESRPYEIGINGNVHYIVSFRETPVIFATITGDILHNLRSALDHLAQQLFLVGTNEAQGLGTHVYFPIKESATKYKSLFEGKVKGMRQDAKDAIWAIEPYNGGKGNDFWMLHELNIIDKHRLLLTAMSSFESADLGGYVSAQFRELMKKTRGEEYESPILSVFFKSEDVLRPLKVGDVLFTAPPIANHNMQFGFQIALNEPGIAEGKPLIETLQHLTDLVSSTVLEFKPCLV